MHNSGASIEFQMSLLITLVIVVLRDRFYSESRN